MSGDEDACERAAQAIRDQVYAPQRRDAAYRDAVESGMSAIKVAERVRAILVADPDFDAGLLAGLGVSHDTVTRAVSSHRQ